MSGTSGTSGRAEQAGWTGSRALEWRIAWRHLRVGERHPRWVDVLMLVSLFLLVVGVGFVLWAGHLGPEPLPGEQLFSAAASSALQRQFGVFGGVSIGLGVMAMVLALLARFFNLLATIITMSVLLGCMALVVVLSLACLVYMVRVFHVTDPRWARDFRVHLGLLQLPPMVMFAAHMAIGPALLMFGTMIWAFLFLDITWAVARDLVRRWTGG